jgi:hypothetical protein
MGFVMSKLKFHTFKKKLYNSLFIFYKFKTLKYHSPQTIKVLKSFYITKTLLSYTNVKWTLNSKGQSLSLIRRIPLNRIGGKLFPIKKDIDALLFIFHPKKKKKKRGEYKIVHFSIIKKDDV